MALMRKILTITILSIIFFGNSSSFSMTDEFYNQLKNNSQKFRNIDKQLNITWKNVTSNMSKADKSKLSEDQSNWIKSGWDKRAEQLEVEQDFSNEDAYTRACEERIKYLENYSNVETNKKSEAVNTQTNTNSSGVKKVGIYDFYLGDNFNSVLKKCIDKKYYVDIKSNYDLPKEFSNYINTNTNFTINPDTSVDSNQVNGKYLNIINNDKTTVSAVVGNRSVQVNTNITKTIDELTSYISNILRVLPVPSDFYGGSKSQYAPDILNKLGIICNKNSIDNVFDREFNNFIDGISTNINNKYDIKSISLKINNQDLNLLFMNSPGANINDILFFIYLNASKVSLDESVKSKINNIFVSRYGEPEILSRELSYYRINNDIIFHEDIAIDNKYYFINNPIMNYFIKSSEMLYNKFKEDKDNSYINGM